MKPFVKTFLGELSKTGVNPLPALITSHDLLKILALLLMLVDHVAYFFDPENLWCRAVGRLSAPIWLFLVGYAKHRDLGAPLWIWGFLLVVANIAVGMPIFPLNILFTILLCRMILPALVSWLGGGDMSESDRLYPVVFAIFVLALPTGVLFEYGTLALLFVMVGAMVRNHVDEKGQTNPAKNESLLVFAVVSSLVYAFYQFLLFGFNEAQQLFVFSGTLALALGLLWFRADVWANLTQRLPACVARGIMGTGRHTLAIYGAHLLLFKAALLILGVSKWVPFSLLLVDW